MALHARGVVLPAGEVRDLYVVDGRITYDASAEAGTIADGGWIVPGLVDAHCHIGLEPAGYTDDPGRLRHQAELDRDAGALAVRDCGSPVDTRWIDDEVDLPRIIRAGRHIARPKRYLPDIAVEVDEVDLADEVERQARAGDGWVKLVGDWIDRSVGDLAPLWERSDLQAAIDRAHSVGGRVTAHVFAESALPDLVGAGIDCIEHGTGITDDVLEEMATRGTALVPTLINVENFPSFAAAATKYPTYAEHMTRLYETAATRIGAAHEAGVPIFAGTDAGGQLDHGQIAREVQALAAIGMSSRDALGAASWRSRAWLGLAGLDEGAPADFVVYAEDPLRDLGVLAHPTRIVLRGRVIR